MIVPARRESTVARRCDISPWFSLKRFDVRWLIVLILRFLVAIVWSVDSLSECWTEWSFSGDANWFRLTRPNRRRTIRKRRLTVHWRVDFTCFIPRIRSWTNWAWLTAESAVASSRRRRETNSRALLKIVSSERFISDGKRAAEGEKN